uniref:Uncharacterized protein n=1 Tax=Arundo donax TaxID=35708 RepID=A0A0A8YJJ3_ARUDO
MTYAARKAAAALLSPRTASSPSSPGLLLRAGDPCSRVIEAILARALRGRCSVPSSRIKARGFHDVRRTFDGIPKRSAAGVDGDHLRLRARRKACGRHARIRGDAGRRCGCAKRLRPRRRPQVLRGAGRRGVRQARPRLDAEERRASGRGALQRGS